MPYSNLVGELAKKKITIESLSRLLNIHRNSVSNKLKGESSFTVEEAIQIRDEYFPNMDLEKLFDREDAGDSDAEK